MKCDSDTYYFTVHTYVIVDRVDSRVCEIHSRVLTAFPSHVIIGEEL